MMKKKPPLMNLLGMAGSVLWALTIFLRGSGAALLVPRFFLGIAPNLAVGLLIPALLFTGYPRAFGKALSFRSFIRLLLGSFAVIFLSEVIHDRFLGSPFDVSDMAATLVGFTIMVLAFRSGRRVTA